MTDRARDKDTAWAGATLPAFPPLAVDHTTTVCVVGAGVAGLTTAYLLAKEGRGVIVLDDGLVGGGETGLTTAQLSNALDRRWSQLVALHPSRTLHLAAASHTAAIDQIERIVAEEEIDCGFERLPGYLFTVSKPSAKAIRDEIDAAHRVGLGHVHEIARAPLLGFDTGPAAMFPDQAQLHALRYLAGLARAVERLGGRIYTSAHVVEVDEEADQVHVLVKTDRGLVVRANEVVLATHSPFLPHLSIHLKQAGYRSYVIALPVPKGSVFRALYWDTEEPFHYVRLADLEGGDGTQELLLVGGEDHKSGAAADTDQRHARLEAWTRERFPQAGAVVHRWSGEVMQTVDGLGYIGRLDPKSRVSVITGDCGNGMTHGTIAGVILTDLVHGRTSAWAKVYDPRRVNLSMGAVSDFVRDSLETAGHFTEWLTGGDVTGVDQILPGSGAILRRGLHKLAVYRDPQGRIHELSAVCPHLGGIVAWNAAERTWDCPCHASRFECTGKVMHGPATADLKKVENEAPPKSRERVDAGLAKAG
jgi:glycine/D-amino acid oxidase-like deaminating enzyme/nitrite reductase/ring-hydroxylating ferredoxin subunit